MILPTGCPSFLRKQESSALGPRFRGGDEYPFELHTAFSARRSFDYLIGTAEYCWRNGQAERFCSLQIDDQLELCRLLDREVGRFGALEDLVDIVGRDSEHL